MAFNINEYIRVFENLVMNAMHSVNLNEPELMSSFRDICTILGIARADAVISCNHCTGDADKEILFYSSGTCNEDNICSMYRIVGEYTVMCCVYPSVRREALSEDISRKINILLEIMLEIVSRHRENETYRQLAFYDKQIEIYNLEYFLNIVKKLLAAGKITKYTACCFNLRGFSLINNQVGREAGTVIMKEYVDSLQKKLARGGWVFRVNGDCFAALFLHDYIKTVIEHLQGMEIYSESEHGRVFVSAHAGFYMITDEDNEPEDIIDKINAALANARNVSKTTYVFYNETIQQKINELKQIEHIFPQAIANEEFLVYYQPKTNLKNYRLHGAEALCRWKHGEILLPPYKFIPMLEESRDICSLDFYVLEHVCRDITRWIAEGRPVVKVSVNFSRCHLGNMDLHENILSIIDKYKVPHKYIEIELTETTTDVDFNELKRIVCELRREGIGTSIDDFGIGYSSLSVIRDIPWETLKIDKCFLPEKNDTDDEKKKKKIMLKSVIAMSQALGLECITEGVETLEQIILLKKNNCFLAQGFYFDKPLTVDEFEKRLDLLRV